MKYNRNDVVVHKPTRNNTGDTIMIVMEYDEKRKKYKCFNIGVYDEYRNEILYCLEEDLELFDFNKFKEDVEDFTNLINSSNFDELYYEVYEYEGKNYTLIRNAYKHLGTESN